MKIIQRQHQITSHQLPETLHPVLKRIYLNRGVTSAEELDLQLNKVLRADLLGGVSEAVALLTEAVTEDKRILIVGDFDADGATSCALALRALRAMGAHHVDYLVPNRFDFGYGLTPQLVEVAVQNKPDLIVTVDNGIASHDGVDAARKHGIQVLVTDHHLAAETLPRADAIVNPNLPGDRFPSKNLAGVGVIFYVLARLRTVLRDQGWFESTGRMAPNMADYLDLVALGTVADVVPLDQNNRILIDNGLQRIRAGRCCAGILALIEVSKRKHQQLISTDLGFAIGPRLNAAGRLEDMSLGIECLLTDDMDHARSMAIALNDLNLQRREIEADMKQQAMAMLDEISLNIYSDLPNGLCLYDPAWHQGVIGILASRVKEQCHRPVVAFAADDSGLIKGSARSIPGVHIRDVLDAVSKHHPGMIAKFGGHAMAAGLTLNAGQYEAFSRAFDAEVGEWVSAEQLLGSIETDGVLEAEEMNMLLAAEIRRHGPWGQLFPEPAFDDHFVIQQIRRIGQDKQHLKMLLEPAGQNGQRMDAVAFFQAEDVEFSVGDNVHAVYKLDINNFRGIDSLQLIVQKLVAA